MGKIILDTNAYSALLAGDRDVLSALEEANSVFMSTVVMGELYAGFYGGSQFKRNKGYLDAFLNKDSVQVVSVSAETAEIFGSIKSKLKAAGTPLPINDVWLAAHAFETGSKLVTFDAHFKAVPGLRIW